MLRFIPTDLERSRAHMVAYLAENPGVKDDFWEYHILTSEFYAIDLDGEEIGLVGLHEKQTLSFFYMGRSFLRYAQSAIRQFMEEFSTKTALVATNDELFLSLAMDWHSEIAMQAYFFSAGDRPVRPPEWDRALLRIARPEDEAVILDTENVAENIRLGKYYILEKDGVFLGQGFRNPCKITPQAVSIGMSVHPDQRLKGVGRSIIMHLKEMCLEQGLIPVCGCWYFNHNSKRTLESAGFVTQTRLLNITLTMEEKKP